MKNNHDGSRSLPAGEQLKVEEGYLPVVTRSMTTSVPLRDILYIEREGRVIKVSTLTGKYRFYQKMDVVLDCLDGHFFQCLKGLVVNLGNIRTMKDRKVEFRNGESLIMAYKPYCRTRQVYSNYIMNGKKGFVHWRNYSSEE